VCVTHKCVYVAHTYTPVGRMGVWIWVYSCVLMCVRVRSCVLVWVRVYRCALV